MRPTFLGALLASAISVLLFVAPAQARLDYSGPAFDILAPGQWGGLPANQYSTDQGQLYDALTPLQGHVTMADVSRDYLSEKFGVQGPVVRVERPKPGLTIYRDAHDIPHIYGRTRADVMFGSGWVAAEDRELLLLEGLGPAYLATLDVPGINPFSLVTSARSFTPEPADDQLRGAPGERAAAGGLAGPAGAARSPGLGQRHQRVLGNSAARARSCRRRS